MSAMNPGPLIPRGVNPSEAGKPPLETTVRIEFGDPKKPEFNTLNVTSHGVPQDVWGLVVKGAQERLKLPDYSSIEVVPHGYGVKVLHYRPQFGPIVVYEPVEGYSERL